MKSFIDVSIENAFLGSLIFDSKNLDKIGDVNIDWFKSSRNKQKIFNYIMGEYSKGKLIDPIALKSAFKKNKNILVEIDEILNSEFNPSNFDSYYDILEEKYLQREITECFNECSLKIENTEQGNIRGALDYCESSLFKITQKGISNRSLKTIGEVGVECMEHLRKVKEEGISPFLSSTGLIDIDKIIGGFSAGDFVLIAGRPSVGKTALALQIGKNNVNKNKPIGMISLEMSSELIYYRYMTSDLKIDSTRIRSGQFTSLEFEQMAGALGRIKEQPFIIDDTSPLNDIQVRGVARRMVSIYGIKMLIIDYIQQMRASERTTGKQEEVSRISNSLKNLAKELKIPIIALSQLSRSPESRESKRPILSDLRETGALEQDADIVFLLYRPEYYGIAKFDDGEDTKNIVEIIIGKSRNTNIGTARVLFFKETGIFTDLAHKSERLNYIEE